MATITGNSGWIDSGRLGGQTIYIRLNWTITTNASTRKATITFTVDGRFIEAYFTIRDNFNGGSGDNLHLKVAGTELTSSSNYLDFDGRASSGTKVGFYGGTLKTCTVGLNSDGSLDFYVDFLAQAYSLQGVVVPGSYVVKCSLKNTYYYSSDDTGVGPDWSGPSTSGFYINRSPNRVKPDGTITASTGGMSGGSGNGSTKAYQIYFTIYRGSNKIYTSSRFDGASKSFKPSDYYADTRPGDKVYVHGVGRSKNASGSWYNVIDKAADAVTVYKDGAIYYKNSSGSKVECTSGYYKDNSSTKRSARYVKIKDSGGSTRIIDVYTSAY